MLDVEKIRSQFPVLSGDDPPVYLDSAATALKPRQVIDRVVHYMSACPANVHRGAHHLSEEAGRLYENARGTVAKFINAPATEQVIFTGNTTTSINLAARSLKRLVPPGRRRILVPLSEHHSNLLPWMDLQAEGFTLKFIPVEDEGKISLEELYALLDDGTAMVAMAGITNLLGVINPWREACRMARDNGSLFLLDWAQGAPRMPLDLSAEPVPDFIAFSGHKTFGPTGIGVLYGRRELLEKIHPLCPGGGTVERVDERGYRLTGLPHRLEGGTPPIAAAIGLGAAIEWIESIGIENVTRHERDLTDYAIERLGTVDGLTLYGPPECDHRAGIVTFNLRGWHCLEVCSVADRSAGICLRGGMMCAAPQARLLSPEGVVRASLGPYNTRAEIDLLTRTLQEMTQL